MKNTPLFTKGQRIAIITLIVMIVCIVGAKVYIQQKTSKLPNYTQEAQDFQKEIERFEASLKQKAKKTYTHKNTEKKKQKAELSEYTLREFNPNNADSTFLMSIGLSEYVTRNILRYRAKGGHFKKPEDLRKIYGMTDEKMEELLPYIVLPVDSLKKTPTKQYISNKKDTIIELNSADTATLQFIKGIGPKYAQRVVYYRERLGGYHHIEQLQEAISLNDDDFEYAKQHFIIDTTLIQTIPVNTASVERLKKHPYINFYAAKSIYDTRRNAFELNNIKQLKGKEHLPDTTLRKLSPYLSFETRNKISHKQ